MARRLFNYKNHGFSLLELIIVLVIIGVIVAAITTSISDGRRDKLSFEVRRLAARISLARDEAILTNVEMGIEIKENSYRFLHLAEDRWQSFGDVDERQLIEQKLPEEMKIQLTVEGLFTQFQEQASFNKLFSNNPDDVTNEEDPEKNLRPQIYLMTSGEFNSFNMVIGYDTEEPLYYILVALFDGGIHIDGPFMEPLNFSSERIEKLSLERSLQN